MLAPRRCLDSNFVRFPTLLFSLNKSVNTMEGAVHSLQPLKHETGAQKTY